MNKFYSRRPLARLLPRAPECFLRRGKNFTGGFPVGLPPDFLGGLEPSRSPARLVCFPADRTNGRLPVLLSACLNFRFGSMVFVRGLGTRIMGQPS